MNIRDFCNQLEEQITAIYEVGISMEDAEKLAAKFLHAQIKLASELKTKDLDARMRKSGLKAVRAAVYTEACQGHDKKPTEAQLSAVIDTNDLVSSEQDGLDRAEVERDELERFYNIFGNGHIYCRGIAKGTFGG